MLKIQKFVFNPFNENTYLVWDEDSKICAIIDPGCYNNTEREAVINFINANDLKLEYLINTHCHIDHIFGNAYLKEKFNPIFLASEKDMPILKLMPEVARKYNVELTFSPLPDKFISEQEALVVGNCEGKFLFTPGHSPGEFCIYFERERVCFTGDVLFNGNIGRTDLLGGNYETLIESIQKKLFTLPDDVTIYPGHESSSTIENEKKNNPFFN